MVTASLAAGLAALLAACSTSVPAPLKSQSQSLANDQTLRVRVADPPRSLDPAKVEDQRELAVVQQFSEPLLKPGAGMRDVQPAAAQSYDISPDGLTWTFHLRANGRYASGQQVRAADFVFAWRRLMDPRTSAPHEALFARVVKGGEVAQAADPSDGPRVEAALDGLGIRAVDDLTLQITTREPAAELKWIATLPEGGPMRPDMVGQPGVDGNGPFRVQDSSPDHTTLVPNSYYWAGRPTLAKIVVDYGENLRAAAIRYTAGGFEEVVDPPDPIEPAARRDVFRVPELTTFWFAFNTSRAPFDNPRVRQAFAMAIDREAIVAGVFHGRAEPATSLIPRGMRGFHPEYGRPQESNPAAARQLLDQAGIPKEQLTALPMIVRDRDFDRQFAGEVAAQLLHVLGVGVAVQVLSPADYSKRLRAGDYALAGPTGWTADYPDQQDFFDIFRSSDGNNAARWRNPRYDALVKLADTEINDEKRDQLYGQAHQLLEQESPVMFVAQRDDWSLVKPYVRGVTAEPVDAWPGAVSSALLYIAAH